MTYDEEKLKKEYNNTTLADNLTVFSVSAFNDPYFAPFVRASLLGFKIHPEILDWVAARYKQNLKLENNITSGIANFFNLGHYFKKDVNQTNVQLFEKKLTESDRLKIKFTDVLMNIAQIESIETKIFIHAALINYYLYPEILDFIMKHHYRNKQSKPTIVRHFLYETIKDNKIKVIIVFIMLLYAANLIRKKRMTSRRRSTRRSRKRK